MDAECGGSAVQDSVAGVNPADLSGTKTAVMAAVGLSEFDAVGFTQGTRLLGLSKTMQANRISFCYNLVGQSIYSTSHYNLS